MKNKYDIKYPSVHSVLNLSNVGRRIYIRCPAGTHRDSTPSFVVYPDGGFHCFGCNIGGSNGMDFLVYLLRNSRADSESYLKEKGLLTD